MSKKKKSFKILILLYAIDVLVCILPLLVPVIVNWAFYTASVKRTVTLSIGMVMLIAVSVLVVIGKLPKGIGGVFWIAVFDLILFLIDPIVGQLKWLLLATATGQLLSVIAIRPFTKKYKTDLLQQRQASFVADAFNVNAE